MNFMISLSFGVMEKEVHVFPEVVTLHSKDMTIMVTVVTFRSSNGRGSNQFPRI